MTRSRFVAAQAGLGIALLAFTSAVWARPAEGPRWPRQDRDAQVPERVLVEDFEDADASNRWRAAFGDDAAHGDDPSSNYVRRSRKGEPAKDGSRSLRVGPVPPVPPYTRGFGHLFVFRTSPVERPRKLVNLGLYVRGTGKPSAVRLLYKAKGKKYWRTLEQDTSYKGWRWLSWPSLEELGPQLVVVFDFVNLSDRPLTFFVDGVAFNHEVDDVAPRAPKSLVAQPEPLHVELGWQPSPAEDLHGHGVFRSAGEGRPDRFLAPVRGGESTYTDWDLPLAGGTFSYHVRAIDGAGRESAASKTVTVEVPPFQSDPKLLRRLHDVVAGVIAERCGPRTRWGNREDLREWADLGPELNFRTWFQWGAYDTGWFPSPRLRRQPFKPFRHVVEAVREDDGLFCAAVCCKYGNALQVPLGKETSMAPYWTGLGTTTRDGRTYAFRDNTRLSRGLDLTVAHAVARLDAGADMLWFDMQPFDPSDQRTLRNRLKWEARLSHRKGLRDSPDVLVGSDIYHQPFYGHPGRKDASVFDYRVEQGGKLFYEGRAEAPFWGNSLFRNADGRYLTHNDAGTAAHLDVSSTKINFCHGWLYYTGAGWTAGLYERIPDVPVLCFIDWKNPTSDFMRVPAREQANFFRVTAAELIACGWIFCFPVQAWDYNARRQGTYAVIRRLVHFYRHWADLYRDREVLWTTESSSRQEAHSFPHCLTVRVGIEGGGGAMRNAGNAGLSYVVNDQPQEGRRIVHLFNHNVVDGEVRPQEDVRLTIPVVAPIRRAYVVSPDGPDPKAKRDVEFETLDGTVRCRTDLEYYTVVVLEADASRDR